MRLDPRLLVALALVAGGCTYVSDADYQDAVEDLDQDGDGFPQGRGDCDDADGARFPGNTEAPYDGVDNDCDGFDLVDVDRDGFPGIAKADWAAASEDTEWPAGVGDALDCADRPSLTPGAANAWPGNPTDPPYDAIDGDCAGDNDFDHDGDGDMPPTVGGQDTAPLFEAYAAAWGLDPGSTIAASYGDCDDFDAAAFTDAAGEVPYDGVDTDCVGDNDFDADGDGYMPYEDAYATLYASFLDRFHGGVAPGAWGGPTFGDCDDALADVNPGAADAPYDGVDADCAGDNDFDADADGWIRPGDEAAFADYLADWGYDLSAGVGDCDDAEPGTHPGTVEALGDAGDADCDGGVDTATFVDSGYAWVTPRSPRVARTTDHWIVAVTADSFTADGVVTEHAGVAWALEPLLAPLDAPSAGPILWQGAAPLGDQLDLVANLDTFTVATTYTVGPATYLAASLYEQSGATYVRENQDVVAGPAFTARGVDVVLDRNDEPWAWACGDGRLQVLHGDGSSGSDDLGLASASGDACFIEDPEDPVVGTGTVCDATGCETWRYDPPTLEPAPTQGWAGEALVWANHIDGWTVAADAAGGILLDDGASSYLVGESIQAVDVAADHVGAIWYVAIVDDAGAIHLLYGNPALGPLAESEVPFTDGVTAWTPTGVGLAADANRVVLVASAADTVAWTVFEP